MYEKDDQHYHPVWGQIQNILEKTEFTLLRSLIIKKKWISN
jgi:hypothetical protein